MRTEREKSLHGEGRREERESNDFRLNSLGEERRREREREKKKGENIGKRLVVCSKR